jgi:hypothetical protein
VPHTVTGHVWLRLDPAGPAYAEPAADDEGCNQGPKRGERGPVGVAALAFFALVAIRIARRS